MQVDTHVTAMHSCRAMVSCLYFLEDCLVPFIVQSFLLLASLCLCHVNVPLCPWDYFLHSQLSLKKIAISYPDDISDIKKEMLV